MTLLRPSFLVLAALTGDYVLLMFGHWPVTRFRCRRGYLYGGLALMMASLIAHIDGQSRKAMARERQAVCERRDRDVAMHYRRGASAAAACARSLMSGHLSITGTAGRCVAHAPPILAAVRKDER